MSVFDRPRACAVSSRRRLAPSARSTGEEVRALEAWIESAIAAGVDILQIRERDLAASVLRDIVRTAVRLAAPTATIVLVNDRADVAAAAGADGVHLPSRGLPIAVLRRLRSDWMLGRSVHDDDDPAGSATADYVLYGTVFPSGSKRATDPVAGLDGLKRAVSRSTCPVIAIGGISPDRARLCLDQGAAGVAAIELFLPPGLEPQSLGPDGAMQALRQVFK